MLVGPLLSSFPLVDLLGRFRRTLCCLLSDVIYGFGVVLGLAVLPSAPIVEVFLPRCPFCDASWSPRCWRQQLEDPNQFLPLFTFRI